MSDNHVHPTPTPLTELNEAQSWLQKNHVIAHIDDVPVSAGLRDHMIAAFDERIEYMLPRDVSKVNPETFERIGWMVALIAYRVPEEWAERSEVMTEDFVQEVFTSGREKANKFLAEQLPLHAERVDLNSPDGRLIFAKYKSTVDHPFESWEAGKRVRDIQSSLRWLSGEDVPDWRYYFRDIPVDIESPVRHALQKAARDIRQGAEGNRSGVEENASAARDAEIVEGLANGEPYRASETHWTVVDPEHFQATYLPDLEEQLMQSLVDVGFLPVGREGEWER